MKNKRVLILGAGIAGPTMGFFLHRYGFDVTIVESASQLKRGGHNVDIRGSALDVLKKMGVYDKTREFRTVRNPVNFLNEVGEIIQEIPKEDEAGEDMELSRGDLAQVLFEATSKCCKYIFDCSIRTIKQDEREIVVEFTNGDPGVFDLLIGADGTRSKVRALIFGAEDLFSHDLGDYFVAVSRIERAIEPDREIIYSQKGKLLYVYQKPGQGVEAQFVFHAPGLDYHYKDVDVQKEIVSTIYADAGWGKVSDIVKMMRKSSVFYFDRIVQIKMDHWFKGRTVLVGDAAYCPCLTSGQGTSLAMVGAYVLAGELFSAQGEYADAFKVYEEEMRAYVDVNQKLGKTIMEHMIPESTVEPWMDAIIHDQIHVAANCIRLKEY